MASEEGELQTPRLILRHWCEEDLEPFAAINADPMVMRYLGGRVLTKPESDSFVKRVRLHFDEHGFGLWAVEVKRAGTMVGFIGLAYPHFLPEIMPTVEIGWRLSREFWGRGLATEGAAECMRYGFESLAIDALCSVHDPRNVASRRVMEKLGMTFERDTARPDDGRPVRVFKITREEWRGR